MAKAWYVYLVVCRGGTFYCGITNDLVNRIAAHNAGHGAKYTRGRRPIRLVYNMPYASRGAALRAEARIKRLSRGAKKVLAFAGLYGASNVTWTGTVSCRFCREPVSLRSAHRHDKAWVCPACWDERLRTTE